LNGGRYQPILRVNMATPLSIHDAFVLLPALPAQKSSPALVARVSRPWIAALWTTKKSLFRLAVMFSHAAAWKRLVFSSLPVARTAEHSVIILVIWVHGTWGMSPE
jgi:hypothetical protein